MAVRNGQDTISVGDMVDGTGDRRDDPESTCGRTRELFQRGLPLATMLERGPGREVRLFAGGGLAILDRLEQVEYDVFSARPTLSRWAKIALVARTFLGGGR